MKKVLLILLASMAAVSCKKAGENEFIITADAKGVADGTEVFLVKQDSTGRIVNVDTAKVQGGKFEFEGKVTEPTQHYIKMQEKGKTEQQSKYANQGFTLILEQGDINVQVDKDTLQKSKVTGTLSNDSFAEYLELPVLKKVKAYEQANQKKYTAAMQKNDTATMGEIIRKYKPLSEAVKKESLKFIEKNPKSYYSLLFLSQNLREKDADLNKLQKDFDNLDPSLKKTYIGKKVKEMIPQIKQFQEANAKSGPAVGTAAPEFSAPTPDGKTLSLKQAMGKVTLVDFWASWCGPCRKESPNVVALYNEFHAKGLNIISVSLDQDAAKWKEAIAADKLAWAHVSNLKQWKEPIAMQYNVKSIPATFLLDSRGIIVAKDLQGEALKEKVASLLK
ncbi:TlpA disulfide reductase family protein [Flavobacterium pallidum]|uniref:Peroxiredoxin n=1 Tax=Flavobacterium pallidum TaxID=2172098 RepID=A0A2S1SKJ9_9FLAO|nr:TlpA disulfide reductase family protein [Flavobacterium pallidum]AWI26925.1 peroxiredoxin [Flavobacterium pallidum]